MIRFLTAGESHGVALVAILEGIPANLQISAERINSELARRQMGYGRGDRMRIEHDQVEIVSGVRYGNTTGSPISLMIRNSDASNWHNKLSIEAVSNEETPLTAPRPGHADYAGATKYHQQDIRNIIERSSARETAMRVACGAIAKQLLGEFGITIGSYVTRIGDVQLGQSEYNYNSEFFSQVEKSTVRCPDSETTERMKMKIDEAKTYNDTLGGAFRIVALGVPPGLGSYSQADRRIDGIIAGAMLSIPAIKAVSIGDILDDENLLGSAFHDEMAPDQHHNISRTSNRAGGIEGGITNGESIIIHAIMKPLSSLSQPLQTVDLKTGEATVALRERSDTCAVPAAAIVAEHVLALVLANALHDKCGGDSVEEMHVHFDSWGKRWRSSF